MQTEKPNDEIETQKTSKTTMKEVQKTPLATLNLRNQ